MKDFLIHSVIAVIVCIAGFCLLALIDMFIAQSTKKAITSSPVEEMYHRQLVVTLDSILDARFGAGCCEQDIDTVNANTFNTRFGSNILPID